MSSTIWKAMPKLWPNARSAARSPAPRPATTAPISAAAANSRAVFERTTSR